MPSDPMPGGARVNRLRRSLTDRLSSGPSHDVMPAPVAIAAITGSSGVEARIARIRDRIGVAEQQTFGMELVDPSITAPDPAGFDPFGEAYQAALAAVEQSPAASAPAPGSGFGLSASTPTGATWTGGMSPTSAAVAPMSSTAPVATGVPGSSVGRIGGFGPMPVPPELQAYGNGRIPSEAMVPIGQGGHRLHAPAAQAWMSAVEAAAADGITLRITDSYRSYDQQVDLVRRKGLYSQGGYGAVPGTSNHGWGLAVDVDVSDPATLSWIRSNGWRFGFVEAVPREPWHWEYRPHQA